MELAHEGVPMTEQRLPVEDLVDHPPDLAGAPLRYVLEKP